MISCEDAIRRSEARRKEILDDSLKTISSLIEQAIEKGENHIVLSAADIPIDILCSKRLEVRLRDMGYTVESSYYFPEACCVDFFLTVSWTRKSHISLFDKFLGFVFG